MFKRPWRWRAFGWPSGRAYKQRLLLQTLVYVGQVGGASANILAMSRSRVVRHVSFVATCVFIMTLAHGAAAQEIAPPDQSKLAPGYHVDAFGCVLGPDSSAASPISSPADRRASMSQGAPIPRTNNRSLSVEDRRNLLNAVALRRRELRSSPEEEAQKDASIRVPLSVDLAKLGNLASARRIWRDVLTRRSTPDEVGFSELRRHRYAIGLRMLRTDVQSNPVFEDSGALAHLQRGIIYANHGNYESAAIQWRLAVRCSPNYERAHLLLGVVEKLQGRPIDARSEWVATLEISELMPPGPRSVSAVKYEAMALLNQ